MTLLLRAVARALLIPGIAVAAAILVKGYSDTGDGFSAGAIAGLTIALQYLAVGREAVERRLPLRWLPWAAPAGLLLALVIALQSMLRGEPILTHLPAPGREPVHVGTLELTTAFAFDLALFLLVVGFVVSVIHLLAAGPEGERE